jgi:hypothetical protein
MSLFCVKANFECLILDRKMVQKRSSATCRASCPIGRFSVGATFERHIVNAAAAIFRFVPAPIAASLS